MVAGDLTITCFFLVASWFDFKSWFGDFLYEVKANTRSIFFFFPKMHPHHSNRCSEIASSSCRRCFVQNAQMNVGILIKKHSFLVTFHKDNLFSQKGFTSQKQTFKMVGVKGTPHLAMHLENWTRTNATDEKHFGVMNTPLPKTVCEKLALGKLSTKS